MLSRFRRADDGSVAVLAAVTFPVVLLCVALAVAAMVWSSSEHEAQRAADSAAARAAATAFLGTDFPYAELPGVGDAAYPTVAAIAAAAGVAAPDVPDPLGECGTVGVPPVPLGDPLPGLPVTLGLPTGCADVGPFVPPAALGLADQSRSVACSTARAAMAADTAPYANRFFAGEGESQPSCNDRIGVRLSTGSPLVGFGAYATDVATGALDTQVVPQATTVAAALAAFGIRLGTSLPSLLCPSVSVTVDQPVREPVFDKASEPNGRATARRIVKNAVVVPVYEGRVIQPVPAEVAAAADGTGVTTVTGTTVTVPPANLNSTLLAAQRDLLTLLDEVDAIADAAVRAAGVSLDQLNGTFDGIDPAAAQPAPLPGSGELEGLRLTQCLRDTLGQVFDPPSGDAPTTDEVLRNAASAGEQVVVVQVGAVQTGCTEPGAVPVDIEVATPSATPECIRAATTPRVDPVTGIYEVPFFDVTPVLVQDVGDGNYAAVPVHASQASGAFRASLVRATDDERYDPTLRRDPPTPMCQVTVPAPTPVTACDILDVPTAIPTPPLPTPTLPLETPTLPVPTLPLETPTLPVESPTLPVESPTLPLPSPTPTVSLSPTCIGLLCGVTG